MIYVQLLLAEGKRAELYGVHERGEPFNDNGGVGWDVPEWLPSNERARFLGESRKSRESIGQWRE